MGVMEFVVYVYFQQCYILHTSFPTREAAEEEVASLVERGHMAVWSPGIMLNSDVYSWMEGFGSW
jgi:hypothetical protein